MKVTRFIDRKLIMIVLGPAFRHLANLLSLYLAGQGVSSGLINQLEAGVIALATVAVNVLFELRDQGKVAESAAVKAAFQTTASLDVQAAVRHVAARAQFDRESA